MELKKKDFIEVEFTGKTSEGEIFDSNIKEVIKDINSNVEAKPFIFSLGENMFLEGVDEFLTGKTFKPGENFKIELPSEKAFGLRDSKLVQLISMRVFKENKINPAPGLMVNLDGRIAKILSVSGGRVMVDFNNPIAGKEVVYDLKILRKVDDVSEKVKAINEFLFRREFKFEIDEKAKKILFQIPKEMKQFVEMFEDKFKDIIGYGLDVKETVEEAGKKVEKEVSKESQ